MHGPASYILPLLAALSLTLATPSPFPEAEPSAIADPAFFGGAEAKEWSVNMQGPRKTKKEPLSFREHMEAKAATKNPFKKMAHERGMKKAFDRELKSQNCHQECSAQQASKPCHPHGSADDCHGARMSHCFAKCG